MKNKFYLYVVMLVFMFAFVFSVHAAGCWDYTTESTCGSTSDSYYCEWKNSPWGSWCEEKSCWNTFAQSTCTQGDNSSSTSFINKTCSWVSNSYSWCAEVDCWSFDGTNQSACESNSLGVQCTWNSNYCMGPPEKQCGTYTSETTCEAVAGCGWGTCMKKSCWDHTTASACTAGTGFDGGACKWNAQYSYCQESGCWDYTDKASCTAVSTCNWNNGYCSKLSCWSNSYTNATACVNNTAGLNCQWNTPYCEEKNCGTYTAENTCTVANSSSGRKCQWNTYSGGSCKETGCSDWDSWAGGYEAACRGNGSLYKLSCTWNNDTRTANATDGWCYQDISAKTCSSKNGEQDCMSSFYCFWNRTSSVCQDPVAGNGNAIQTDFIAWYPGCYLFDYQGQSACQNVTGCTWVTGDYNPCRGNSTINMTDSTGGVRCNYINNSDMCNQMSQLPYCCVWQGGTCSEDKLSSSCSDQRKETPEGATYCEDYNAYTDESLCNKIAADPWYMPCRWN
ncbi:hypothetical protein HYX12_01050, partial [Candidatus Woesearchaeota archaeon]|nr:hypothetical protein [Candidatus Woesearchaeota archaeon]